MLQTFNDEDIIQEVIENILSESLEIVVLDNGSTDRTYEICEKFLNKGVLKVSQYQSKHFDIFQNLKILYDIALTFDPDWLAIIDSDEFHETGLKNTPLKDVIVQADKEGYNLIQSNWFEFFLTDNDNESKKSVKARLRYYSSQGDIQYRFWKHIPGSFYDPSDLHGPIFPLGYKYKIFPKKMVLRHYPFRSTEHAKRKMALKIRGRSKDGKDAPPIDAHERRILSQDFSAKVDTRLLVKYEEDGLWDLQIKYNPFNHTIQLKREDFFTDDGMLKKRPKSLREHNFLLREKIRVIKNLREQLEKQKSLEFNKNSE